jgi:hypothetical protein
MNQLHAEPVLKMQTLTYLRDGNHLAIGTPSCLVEKLRNLGGFATSSLTNDYHDRVRVNQVEKSFSVTRNRKQGWWFVERWYERRRDVCIWSVLHSARVGVWSRIPHIVYHVLDLGMDRTRFFDRTRGECTRVQKPRGKRTLISCATRVRHMQFPHSVPWAKHPRTPVVSSLGTEFGLLYRHTWEAIQPLATTVHLVTNTSNMSEYISEKASCSSPQLSSCAPRPQANCHSPSQLLQAQNRPQPPASQTSTTMMIPTTAALYRLQTANPHQPMGPRRSASRKFGTKPKKHRQRSLQDP